MQKLSGISGKIGSDWATAVSLRKYMMAHIHVEAARTMGMGVVECGASDRSKLDFHVTRTLKNNASSDVKSMVITKRVVGVWQNSISKSTSGRWMEWVEYAICCTKNHFNLVEKEFKR